MVGNAKVYAHLFMQGDASARLSAKKSEPAVK
jgi:hypothetical protein